jgi:hypothetical protein
MFVVMVYVWVGWWLVFLQPLAFSLSLGLRREEEEDRQHKGCESG